MSDLTPNTTSRRNTPETCGIYTITNTVNGKVYVGSTVNFASRWYWHKFGLKHGNHGNPHLQRAWNKYGPEMFDFAVVEVCPKESLDQQEGVWMGDLKAFTHGYNLVRIVEGCHTLSDEVKARISAGGRGLTRSQTTKDHIREARTGAKFSDEAKANMSKAHLGHRHSEESRLKMVGRTHSEESKAKIAAARTGAKASDETRCKIQQASRARTKEQLAPLLNSPRNTGKKASVETRAKRSESMKRTLAAKRELAGQPSTVLSFQ